MLNIKFLTTGNLKEAYWRDALSEYSKRLGGLYVFDQVAKGFLVNGFNFCNQVGKIIGVGSVFHFSLFKVVFGV